jgi:putative membrane protein
MLYHYIKALHIIFIVTWFSGLFYMVRLFIYNTEAGDRDAVTKDILRNQFRIMIRRLWFGITWPSAVLTIIFGPWMLYLYGAVPAWLWIKLFFVAGLYFYHWSLHVIFKQQMKGEFRYSSQKLRVWNEVATIFLIAIVMLVVVKQEMSLVWGMLGLLLFVIVLMGAIRIYKALRKGEK